MNSKYSILIEEIPHWIGGEELRYYFSQFGNIKAVNFEKSSPKSSRYNYAIIEFSNHYGFLRALKEKNHSIMNTPLLVKRCLQGKELADLEEDISARRIYMKNIPFCIEEEDLYNMVQDFGEIELFYICKDKRKHASKTDYGFVTFRYQASADRALKIRTLKLEKFNTKVVFKKFNSKGKKFELKNFKPSRSSPKSKNERKGIPKAKNDCDPEKKVNNRYQGGIFTKKRKLIHKIDFDSAAKNLFKCHSKALMKVEMNHIFENLRFNGFYMGEKIC